MNMDTTSEIHPDSVKYILTWCFNKELKQAIFEDRELAESYYETKLAENKSPALYEYKAHILAADGIYYHTTE